MWLVAWKQKCEPRNKVPTCSSLFLSDLATKNVGIRNSVNEGAWVKWKIFSKYLYCISANKQLSRCCTATASFPNKQMRHKHETIATKSSCILDIITANHQRISPIIQCDFSSFRKIWNMLPWNCLRKHIEQKLCNKLHQTTVNYLRKLTERDPPNDPHAGSSAISSAEPASELRCSRRFEKIFTSLETFVISSWKAIAWGTLADQK